jgi:hypothetical protein
MMISDEEIRDSLRESEALAPDPLAATAGIRAGIRRRHRRRTGTAAVAVVAVAGLGGYTAAGMPGLPGLPRPGTGAAAQPADGAPAYTLRFGWLPTGMTNPLVTVDQSEESWLYNATNGPSYLRVSVDKLGWKPPKAVNGWQPVTVGGRHGLEIVAPTRAMLVFPLPSGRSVSLEYGDGRPGGTADAGVRRVAERIAAGLSEGGAQPVRVRVAAGWLPAGMKVRGAGQRHGPPADVDQLTATSGTPRLTGTAWSTTEDGVTYPAPKQAGVRQVTIAVEQESGVDEARGTRLPDIQGRPAYSLNQGTMVAVLNYHGGTLLVSGPQRFVVGGTRPPAGPSLDELVRIAANVNWTG